jgi:glycosyltransferase involved in cell wall biosynthesis
LHTYDLLVQPSRYEGFGLTVVEAMAAGVPVLVSNIEGPMEIIDNGKYGSYFQVGDHLDCSEKMIHIMKNSEHRILPEELQRVAEYARRRFDITETANLYLDAYGKLISRALRWKRDP